MGTSAAWRCGPSDAIHVSSVLTSRLAPCARTLDPRASPRVWLPSLRETHDSLDPFGRVRSMGARVDVLPKGRQ
jgi:hypothetical protein